jgi:WD40 repeat protein
MPVCNNGVTSICESNGTVFLAGGDGRVKAVTGDDLHWDLAAENTLEAGCTALTPSADGHELVAGTRNGKLWRLLSSDLTATLQSATHTGEVTDVHFGASSDVVCTCSDAGEVFLVDLSSYMPLTTAMSKSAVRSVFLTKSTGEILAGYDDGFVRAWSTKGQLLWQIHAHREGVSVVRESADFVVSGGNDCSVRFWHRGTRELLSTFTNHRKPVADLQIDQVSPHLVHSGAEDKLVVTYDLKHNKPLVQHFTQASNITGLSQRKDREREMVSSSLDGKLLFWDVDFADPTGCLDSPGMLRFRCLEVSPSGRYIVAGTEDGRVYIFDLVTCECIQECEGHADGVMHVRWSPDQKQIVSAGKDGVVIVWNFFEV